MSFKDRVIELWNTKVGPWAGKWLSDGAVNWDYAAAWILVGIIVHGIARVIARFA